MPRRKKSAASVLGRLGGLACKAKHPPDYYRKIAEKRWGSNARHVTATKVKPV